jgi:hypothetical protein
MLILKSCASRLALNLIQGSDKKIGNKKKSRLAAGFSE